MAASSVGPQSGCPTESHGQTFAPSSSSNPQLRAVPQVRDDGSRQSIPTCTSQTANITEIASAEGTLVPALRRAHGVLARILRRLESAPAPPSAPPDSSPSQ